MLKQETWRQSKEELKGEQDTGVKNIGGFVMFDVMAAEPKIDFSKIHCMVISDWDAGCETELKNAMLEFEQDKDDHVIHIIILNLNEVEASTSAGIAKMTSAIEEYGYVNITDFIGYETRLAFVSCHNDVSKQALESFQ